MGRMALDLPNTVGAFQGIGQLSTIVIDRKLLYPDIILNNIVTGDPSVGEKWRGLTQAIR